MNENCTVYRTMELLSKKWAVIIMLELYKMGGWNRFSEIKRSMRGITPKMLSERLKDLESWGMVERKVDLESVPIKVAYRLTEMGRDLFPTIRGIKQWAIRWGKGTPECMVQECSECIL